MIGVLPDWMLDQGSKSNKYFVKQFHRLSDLQKAPTNPPRTPSPSAGGTASPSPPRPSWRIKTQQEYIQSLSPNEIHKKGGLAKLEKQPTNRYFKRKKLSDIVMLHGHANDDKEQLGLFVHFLLGILDPDPWKRWTALQASQHPFITGSSSHRRRTEERRSREFDIYWVPPWDPSICRRKLLNVQKTREKQQAMRRNFHRSSEESPDKFRRDLMSPAAAGSGSTSTSRVTAMTDAMSLSRHSNSHSERTSPPSSLGVSTSNSTAQSSLPAPHNLTGSLGSVIAMHQADPSSGVSLPPTNPPTNYLVPSSSSYDIVPPTDRISSSMMASSAIHGVSFGEAPPAVGPGAQSFSGVSYEGVQVPIDADFGYALQRPGVVPGSGIDPSGSYSSLTQQVSAVAFSPHHHLPPRRASGVPNVSGPATRNAALMRAAASTGGASLPSSSAAGRRRQMGLVPQSPRQYISSTATASIQEDSADFARSSVSTSLLAQQMEEAGAASQSVAASMGVHDMMITEGTLEAQIQQQQMMHAGYVNQNMYGLAPPSTGGYYTYVSANGTPIMTAVPPSNGMMPAAMPPATMNHLTGSYEHMSYAMGSLGGAYPPPAMHSMPHSGMYPPAYRIDQHLLEDLDHHQHHLHQTQQQQPQQQQHRIGRQNASGIPPQYRGMSM
uniref:Protein kinase domain-containing protein n=1 Tax=Cyclophora tenuis TaxID=216820 RepID=A0A7S1GLQ8_CYCTE